MGLKESGLRGSLRNVSVGIDAIPDSAVAHYDASRDTQTTGSISSIDDQVGDFDLSGSAELLSSQIASRQTYRFDGTEEMSQDSTMATTEPFAWVGVFQIQEDPDSNDGVYVDGGSNIEFYTQYSDGDFIVGRGGGNERVGGTPTQNVEIVSLIADNNDEVTMRVNGSEVGSASEREGDLTGLMIAQRRDGSRNAEIDFGELVILEDYNDGDVESEENRIADKWDVSI